MNLESFEAEVEIWRFFLKTPHFWLYRFVPRMRSSAVVVPIAQLFRLCKSSFSTKMANAQLGKLYSSNVG